MKFQAFLLVSLVLSFLLVISAENEQCGRQAGGALCPNGNCCSKGGFCGITAAYCGEGCQSQCHHLSSFLDQSTFDEMFPNQYSNDCPSQGFYTYDALISAAKCFSGFASVGDDETRKREIAAFLAQISHESSGVHAVVPLPLIDRYVWGLCILSENNPPSNYCNPHYICPKEYYGRGPFQLKWNKNYIECGEYTGCGEDIGDLVNNPDLLVTDPVISFKSALWFWMTSRSDKYPSCHEVMTGEWQPTEGDESKGWFSGFGLTTNIINGVNECGNGQDTRGANRIGYFAKYCDLLTTTTGDNLDCYKQTPMVSELTLLPKTM